MRKYNLLVDYKNSSKFGVIPILAKGLREAGKEAENLIDEFSQQERKAIYCFTLENSKGEVLGRFRPHRYNDCIVFTFRFED